MTSLYIHEFMSNRKLINTFKQYGIQFGIGDPDSSHMVINSDERDSDYLRVLLYHKILFLDDAYCALAVLICEQMNVKILRAPESDHSAQ